jgi:hypothetical protein
VSFGRGVHPRNGKIRQDGSRKQIAEKERRGKKTRNAWRSPSGRKDPYNLKTWRKSWLRLD